MVIDYFFLKNKWNINAAGIIHIGAHHGQEISTYYKDQDVRNIILFEPSVSSFKTLKENISRQNRPSHILNITAYNCGLGPEEKEVDFFVASNGQSSSVLKPKIHITQHPDITFNSMEKINIKTLDSFNFKGYEYINMDVQGYELQVLKGAINTLKDIKWIYTEVNNQPLYEECTIIDNLDLFLEEQGFKRQDTSWCKLHGNWGDALYIKN